MPWEKQYDETEVLERAMSAFWRRGYEATSISDLVEATGINRGSIYAAYSDKHTLFIETLRHYDKRYRADFLEQLACTRRPKEAILAAFESAARPGDGETPGGCLLVNTALEVSPHDPEIRAFVNASFGKVEDFFCRMIKAARKQGTVPGSVAARETARVLLGLFLGLRVLARSTPDRAALDAIASRAGMMLE